ncbi:carboxypeptidase-like regulatory domain-containing protein [Croceivirga radicis]|uniref:carboxypeptidase-like regulatory domain-containing protein n=1 Tax=Croceivirga radicis TaxID=1929488 RepID=UPI000255B599|nr:carboxypeptidase-like regulatory domain-containing protein [Croceivirga radicis]
MKRFKFVFILANLVLISTSIFAQKESFREYGGVVLEEGSNKPLALATLSVENTNTSTITNTDGEFSLKVPLTTKNAQVVVSFLGYETKTVPLTSLKNKENKIYLTVAVTQLAPVDINAPKNVERLVWEVFSKKGEKYFDKPTIMTAFYRETIKKRRKNVSLSEAVVTIYKSPYEADRKDAMKIYKARKSTDYSKLDTVALKLQGGPFNTLYVDLIRYPQYVFSENAMNEYDFKFNGTTYIDNRLIYIVDFNQLATITSPLYKGKLYIDATNKTLTSAIYQLNITDRNLAAKLFVRRKPANVDVWPTEVAYRVDYREQNGKWYFGYSNILMEFKVDWKGKLFNSVYSMAAEMAITDWENNTDGANLKNREKLKSSIILADEADGFSDPDFWGAYNIIEPEKSIENAIKKIQRQLKREERKGA